MLLFLEGSLSTWSDQKSIKYRQNKLALNVRSVMCCPPLPVWVLLLAGCFLGCSLLWVMPIFAGFLLPCHPPLHVLNSNISNGALTWSLGALDRLPPTIRRLHALLEAKCNGIKSQINPYSDHYRCLSSMCGTKFSISNNYTSSLHMHPK